MAGKIEINDRYRNDILDLSILSGLAALIGTYLLVTMDLIAKDGVSYIHYAQRFIAVPWQTLCSPPGDVPHSYTPGYPLLIFWAHRIFSFFGDETSFYGWIYSAQAVTLMTRILAIIPLYFIGKLIVGAKKAFWAMFILIMLPNPARIGSDALRDWPGLLFLSLGLLFLLIAVQQKKWNMFGLVGFIAAVGYVIRPENGQLIVYGALWLVCDMLRKKDRANMSKTRNAAALAFLIAGFAVLATPYMVLRGELLPDRLTRIIDSFCWGLIKSGIGRSPYLAALVPQDIMLAFKELVDALGKNFMYFFLPFMTIGVFIWLRQHSQKMGSKFFVTTFIFLNIAVLVLRYCCVSPDLSTRYALPLTSLTVFFVPDGLEAAGVWIQRMFGRKSISEDNTKQWFLVLLTIGLITCIPKLLTPIRDEKPAYLQAADWLKTNTTEQDRIVAFDIRIGFYAQRNAAGTPENGANYVAKKIKGYEKPPKDMIEAWSMYLSDRGNGDKLVIYRRIAQ